MKKKTIITAFLVVLLALAAVVVVIRKKETSVSLNGNELKSEVSCITVGREQFISVQDLNKIFAGEIKIDKNKLEITSPEKLGITKETAAAIGEKWFTEHVGNEYVNETNPVVAETERDGEAVYEVYRSDPRDALRKDIAVMNDYYILINKQGEIIMTP